MGEPAIESDIMFMNWLELVLMCFSWAALVFAVFYVLKVAKDNMK